MTGRKSALVVEDDAQLRALFLGLLSSQGFAAAGAATLVEARARVKRAAFHLVLVDTVVAGENGLEFIRLIRQTPMHPNRRSPMLVISGWGRQAMILAARDSGANGFVAKPVTIAGLRANVARALADPRAFVESAGFAGPDRRCDERPYSGPERRKDAGTHFI